MIGFGQPGGYLTYNNRYSSLTGQPQQQQQQGPMGGSLTDQLSNAKQGYDTYAMFSGKPSSTSYMMDLFGLGGGAAPSASSAWGAGNYGAFAVPEAGATSLGGTSSAGGSSWLGSLGGGGGAAGAGIFGPLGIIGAGLVTAYLLDKKHNKEQAQKKTNEANLKSSLGPEGYTSYVKNREADRLAAADNEDQRRSIRAYTAKLLS